MATMTYYVAIAFKRSEEGNEIVECDPEEARRLYMSRRHVPAVDAA